MPQLSVRHRRGVKDVQPPAYVRDGPPYAGVMSRTHSTSATPVPSVSSVTDVLPATPAHAPGIVALRDELARWMQARGIDQWREGEFTPAQVEQEIAAGQWWVVEPESRSGEVLGSVRVIWEDLEIWGEQPEPAGYIHGVAVDRSLTGTGTGTRLLHAAETVIAASGRRISRLDCDDNNPALKRFYSGLGYTPRGTATFHVPGPDFWVTVQRMERPLP